MISDTMLDPNKNYTNVGKPVSGHVLVGLQQINAALIAMLEQKYKKALAAKETKKEGV